MALLGLRQTAQLAAHPLNHRHPPVQRGGGPADGGGITLRAVLGAVLFGNQGSAPLHQALAQLGIGVHPLQSPAQLRHTAGLGEAQAAVLRQLGQAAMGVVNQRDPGRQAIEHGAGRLPPGAGA